MIKSECNIDFAKKEDLVKAQKGILKEQVHVPVLKNGPLLAGVIMIECQVVLMLGVHHKVPEEGMEWCVSGRSRVEQHIPSEGIFRLQSLPEDTAARSSGGVMVNMETPAIQVRKVQELEKDLEEERREIESLAGSVNKYEVFLKNNDKKLKEEQLKSLALLKKLKRMAHERKGLRLQKDFLHKFLNQLICYVFTKCQKG